MCFSFTAEALSRNVALSNGGSHGIVEAFKASVATCPLGPAIDLIGEKWAIMILRGSLSGLRHFEEFQAGLGIARNILSNRLARLVAGGLLERKPDGADRRRVVYSLTEKGSDLLPTLVAMRQWAEAWGLGSSPIILADKQSGKPLQRITLQAHDGRAVTADDLVWIDTTNGSKLAGKSAA